MQLHYDGEQKQLYIDEVGKQTVIDIPDEFSKKEIRYFLQSDTLYDIISQLKGEYQI